MYNAIQEAFIKVGFGDMAKESFKQGWSCKLSFRTFKKLENEGYTKFNG